MVKSETIEVSFRNNYFITDTLFTTALEKLYQRPEYENTVSYSSMIDDCFVFQLKSENRTITVMRHGENQMDTKIKGDKYLVLKFVRDMLSEMFIILTQTTIGTLFGKEAVDTKQIDEFKNTIIRELDNMLLSTEKKSEALKK